MTSAPSRGSDILNLVSCRATATFTTLFCQLLITVSTFITLVEHYPFQIMFSFRIACASLEIFLKMLCRNVLLHNFQLNLPVRALSSGLYRANRVQNGYAVSRSRLLDTPGSGLTRYRPL
ncbi:hypothetical protein BDW60DRAFT_192482 [Aspergillus nidulans var. acristatus]